MKTTFIYSLKDPITNEIRYIGKTNNIKHRFNEHFKCSSNDTNEHKKNWIRKLKNDGLKPILEIVEEVSIDEWKDKEKYYIKKYLKEGCDLLNFTDGGEGGTFKNSTSFDGRNAKKVVLLNKNGDYIITIDSAKKTEEYIGKSGLDSVLNGKTKTCGGYICLYESKYVNMTKTELDEYVLEKSTSYSKFNGSETRFKKEQKPWNDGKRYDCYIRRKKMYQYNRETRELIKEWSGTIEASKELNLSYDAISLNLMLKTRSSAGYIWSYKKLETEEDFYFYFH